MHASQGCLRPPRIGSLLHFVNHRYIDELTPQVYAFVESFVLINIMWMKHYHLFAKMGPVVGDATRVRCLYSTCKCGLRNQTLILLCALSCPCQCIKDLELQLPLPRILDPGMLQDLNCVRLVPTVQLDLSWNCGWHYVGRGYVCKCVTVAAADLRVLILAL